MQPSRRHEEIVSVLQRAGEMSVEALAEQLKVSRETIRRDLARLDEAGRVRKFHGGARAVPVAGASEKEGPFAQRMAQNVEAKRRIARAAGRLLAPDDAVFIDTGSTTVFLAEVLAELRSLVIITNSPKIASTVASNGTHKIFLIGGAYGADAGETLGPLALEQIVKFRARCVMLTIGAIDASCIMDYDLQEAEVAKAMIERAERTIVLADHDKFERRAVFEVAPLTAIDTLITDARPSALMTGALAEAGVNLIVAEENG
ncbi:MULTISPECIES: DeoR/GlpR family DNA-binding transcription regulator [unclassified Chelatococcus]|uniref:DeoR/GlpR family DNA-binding transcription regulator n=1 Tax=unclassified Chelatococcus TaxID=2638111 RepID=UPI0004746C73|nr:MULTISPECIES: DeoR/GlpR family DNA-binding transcription regulator [unclassified Chelatococcus]